MVQIMSTIPRQFMLVIPSNLDESEKLPVLFIWHWLGGDSSSVMERGFVQASVDELRFIAVVPDAKEGSNLFRWPYSAADTQAAVDEELLFFDDMLSCVSQQFNVNKECVSTGGASAGALWSAQLAGLRGQYIANFISLSGGVGGVIKPFPVPEHKMPALVLWGGPTDSCFGLVDFTSTSQALEDDLTAGGHFFVECIHNCGHGMPPLDSEAMNPLLPVWRFALQHPYWLGAGQSPYVDSGLPADLPPWCGVSKGSATIREGECPSPPEC
jgi:predicted esterase